MNDKPKNDKLKNDAPRLNSILFLVLWIAGHAASWLLAVGINQFLVSQNIFIQSSFLLGMLMALGTGIPTALVQLLLVECGLKKTMRGWLPVSILGWTLSGLAFYWTWTTNIFSLAPSWLDNIVPKLIFLPLFVPVALLQWLWLRRKVKVASLWILSALTGALLFTMAGTSYFLGGMYYGPGLMKYALVAAAALLYSGATGATMLYLWTQAHEKAKNEVAQAEQADADDSGRLEQLIDKEAETQSLLDIQRSAKAAKTTL